MTDTAGYTKLPNEILDALPSMGRAELLIVLTVARKTIGWQKPCDRISLTQFEEATGLTRQSVHDGIGAALAHNRIERWPDGRSYCYSLHGYRADSLPSRPIEVADSLPSRPIEVADSLPSRPSGVYLVDQKEPGSVYLVDTQKKESKERIKKERVARERATPRAPKQADLLFAHPAVHLLEQLAGEKLRPVNRQQVADTIEDLDLWEQAIRAYLGKYPRLSVAGVLDWYRYPERIARATQGPTNHGAYNGNGHTARVGTNGRAPSAEQLAFEREQLAKLDAAGHD